MIDFSCSYRPETLGCRVSNSGTHWLARILMLPPTARPRKVERGSATRSMFAKICNERQPGRAKENSPPIHRWVLARKPDESRQGRQSRVFASNIFFRPSGALAFFPPVTHY